MAYYVNKTDGTAILVLDGTKDITSTSLTLIGRLATNYGEVQNENFLHLLENFALASQPSNPITGQLWFDSGINSLKVRRNDLTWEEVGSNLENTLYLASNLHISANTLEILSVNGNVSITNRINNKNLIFRSNVAGTFTDVLSINGSNGLITVSGNPNTNLGIATKNYVDTLETNITSVITSINSNIVSLNTNIALVNSNLSNTASNLSSLSSNVTSGSGNVNAQSLQISGNTIISASGTGNTVVNFFTPEGLKFISAYGTSSANLVTVFGQWVLGSGATLNSSYADLAEYYASDYDYEPGTVLIFAGSEEVTTTNIENDTRLAGVVSTHPAYKMNVELDKEKVCIALQGRVPCKVIGPVNKGDLLTTAIIAGFATKAQNPVIGAIIGKSLESNTTQGPCVVEISVSRA